MSDILPNTQPINDNDTASLKTAYGILVDARGEMIDAMVSTGAVKAKCNIFVDGIIAGVMSHLHAVASDQKFYSWEIGSNGGNFSDFSRFFALNTVDDITGISRSSTIAATPPLTEDGPAGPENKL